MSATAPLSEPRASVSQPLAQPNPFPPIGRFESAYVTTPCDDGSIRFDVKGAEGYTAPGFVLLILPLIGASIGAQPFRHGWVGFGVGLFFALIIFLARSSVRSSTQGQRAPGGTFYASPAGLRLPNGTWIPRASIQYVVCRNTMDGHVTHFVGVGRGFMGAAAAAGAVHNARQASEITKIAYQVEIESGGRAVPVVGSMTDSTSRAVFDELKSVMGFA